MSDPALAFAWPRSRRRSAIAKLSSVEATQALLSAYRAMAAEAECLRAHRCGRGAAGGESGRRSACKVRAEGAAAWRADGAQGYVLLRRQAGRLRLESPRRLDRAETSTAIKRLQDAGAIRIGALHMAEFAYGPTGHNAYLGPARNPWDIAAHHRRLVVRLGRGGRGAADLCGARLRHRRLDPHAGALLRRHRTEDHYRPRQPRQCDAAVVHARHRRPAGAQRRRLRADRGSDLRAPIRSIR